MTKISIDNRQFYNRLIQLAAPIAFQSLMLASVAAGDALMLGRIAQEEMTAVSLATQIQFVQNIFPSMMRLLAPMMFTGLAALSVETQKKCL